MSRSPIQEVRIKVDPDKEGLIRCVVHELLHFEFADIDTVMSEDLEEEVILALEDIIDRHIKFSRRRVYAWRKAIEAKLAESEHPD